MHSTNGGSREPDIFIAGLGVNGIEHVTKEAESAFRRSAEILAVANHPAVITYLESLCPKVTDLHSISYRQDERRINAYDTMSAMVLDAALEHTPVTFAIYGHPLIYVYPTRQILDAARYLGREVKVLAGVSSLDTMFIDLNLDPAIDGLQMYEATDMLIRRRPLQTDVPLLLWQVGTVESVLYSTADNKPERFSRIKDYLLTYYPPEHRVTAVYSSHHPMLDSSALTFPLADMESYHEDLHPGLTVYLPPVGVRTVADHDLVGKLESVDHLETLTFPRTLITR